MTEKDLKDLGFKKVEVLRQESDNKFDYYYYTLKLGEGLHFTSTDSIDAKKPNVWHVYNYEWADCIIKDKSSIINLKDMYKNG